MSDRDAVRMACATDDLDAAQNAVAAFLALDGGAAASAFAAREATATAERLGLPELRLSILSSFTIEPLEPYIQLREFLAGRRLVFESIAYEQWYGALRTPGRLDAANPDAILLLLHLDDVAPHLAKRHLAAAPELASESDRLVDAIGESLQAYRARSATPVLLSTFVASGRGIERSFDRGTEPSRQAMVEALNNRVAALAREMPGVYVFEYDQLVADAGRSNWFDPVKAHHIKAAVSSRALPLLAAELSRTLSALRGPRRKLVALDLDNTLWGGILGEDGPDGIAAGGDYPGNAYADFQAFLANLRATGIALAVVSKNNPEDVDEAFSAHPNMALRREDFTAWRVNWIDKAANLKSIADELNLSTDSFVFVDDNPMECDLVRTYMPEVAVVELSGPPSGFADKVLAQGGLDTLSLTDEDRRRAQSYAAEKTRAALATSVTDTSGFLAALELRLTLRPPRTGEVERMAQLFGKTNQFNLTTKRYGVSEIEALRADPAARVTVALLQDRYGDYGLIGIVVTIDQEANVREIDCLLISCRALGRNVEESVLADIETGARDDGRRRLIGRYRPSAKNAIVADFYPSQGFTATGREGEFERRLDTTAPLTFQDHMAIVRETAS